MSMTRFFSPNYVPCLLFTLGCLLCLGGCARNQATLNVQSLVADAAMQPSLPFRAYVPIDRNTADIYLSDIPAARLADLSDPLNDVSGHVLHIHIFLMPQAGQTPIDPSACNITVQHLIVTSNDSGSPVATGLYAGGGFCLPKASPGDSVFGGSLLDATLRLARATPGFADRLGPARMAGSFDAPRNDDLARAISARMEAVSRTMLEVQK